jgi:Transposase DDE domain/Putative transposase of IS4/5 family (DUF4096)
LYLLITGSRWQELPRDYGAPTTVWRRLKRWGDLGIWEHIWRAALTELDRQDQLDWSIALLDGSFAPARKGGDKVGLTRKGKGTTWMLVVDGNGLPLGVHLDSANKAKAAVNVAEQTLDTIRVARPRGRPKRRPQKLVADRGDDRSAFRAALRRRGIGMGIMGIPPKRRPPTWRAKRGRPERIMARKEDDRQRDTVERSFAWLGNFRRLRIRWESFFALYRSFFAGAVMLLCVRRATAFACPFPLGHAARGRGGGVRGAIGSTTLEHERLRAEVTYEG